MSGVKSCEPYYSGVCRKVLTVKLPLGQHRAKLFHTQYKVKEVIVMEQGTEYMPVKGYKGYWVSRDGKIWSEHKNGFKAVSPTAKSKYLYWNVEVKGKTKHLSVHRTVAEAFIPNPEKLPEVDHINRNILDNRVDNLRWVDRLGNLKNSSCGMVRNHRMCVLVHDGGVWAIAESIKEMARVCEAEYGLSKSSMEKYRKVKGYEIKSVTTRA